MLYAIIAIKHVVVFFCLFFFCFFFFFLFFFVCFFVVVFSDTLTSAFQARVSTPPSRPSR